MLTYDQLRKRTDAPAGSAWGLHGKDDELGTLNFLSPEALLKAIGTVRKGQVFNLDLPLTAFTPPLSGREGLRHVVQKFGHVRDDYVDNLFLQCSTQLDGLRHFRHPIHGFYNYTPDEAVEPGTPRLGIQRFAERGIAGRGVLVDVDSYLSKRQRSLDHRTGDPFSAQLVADAAREQNVEIRHGDILLIRTGWLKFYFEQMSDEDRVAVAKKPRAPGLEQAHETLAWLWDNQIALVATDTPGVEAVPAVRSSPFLAELAEAKDIRPGTAAMMHPVMIPLLGLVLGELWALDKLAADCAKDGVYEFLVTSKPLNLVGGVGSPANAMAIK